MEKAEAAGLELSTVTAAETDPLAMPSARSQPMRPVTQTPARSGISRTPTATSSKALTAGCRATTPRPPSMATTR